VTRFLLLLPEAPLALPPLVLGSPRGQHHLVLLPPFGLDLLGLRAVRLVHDGAERHEDLLTRRLGSNAFHDAGPHRAPRGLVERGDTTRVREHHAGEGDLLQLAAGRILKAHDEEVVLVRQLELRANETR
jgi:hypothetical protein